MNLHDFDNLVLPPIGRPDPTANALKTGTAEDCPRVPEDFQTIAARAGQWHLDLKPQNLYHAWLVDQIAVVSLRIEHLARVERRQRDRAVIRAELFWDDDRSLEAEELGEKLAHAPAKVVNLLKRTPQGCDWMIARWARLARIADVASNWDDALSGRLAFDLLGTRPEDRSGQPGETIDHEGRMIDAPTDLAALARREVAGLLRRKAEVAPLDAVDRTMARADYVDLPSPEVRELRKQDAALHRRLKWYLAQLQPQEPPRTLTRVYKHFLRGIGCCRPGPGADQEGQPGREPERGLQARRADVVEESETAALLPPRGEAQKG